MATLDLLSERGRQYKQKLQAFLLRLDVLGVFAPDPEVWLYESCLDNTLEAIEREKAHR